MGARSALRHNFLMEEPDSICPTDGQEVTLVLKGPNRRFKTQVNKKLALAKEEFYKIFVAATRQNEQGVVRLCRLRLAAQVVLMFLYFARYKESAELKVKQASREKDYLVIFFKKGKTYQDVRDYQ